MAKITINGVSTEIKKVVANGVEMKYLYANNVLVWKKSEPYTVTLDTSQWTYTPGQTYYTHFYTGPLWRDGVRVEIRKNHVSEYALATLEAQYATNGCDNCIVQYRAYQCFGEIGSASIVANDMVQTATLSCANQDTFRVAANIRTDSEVGGSFTIISVQFTD